MASININRAKYSAKKAEATWLDKWIEAQVKEKVESTKTIKEKEVKTTSMQIVPWKLFELIKVNGLDFPGVRAQVDAGQNGAVGRGRMIFAGVIKRKIKDGATLKNVDGTDVEQTPEFQAYRTSLSAPKPVVPETPADPAPEAEEAAA